MYCMIYIAIILISSAARKGGACYWNFLKAKTINTETTPRINEFIYNIELDVRVVIIGLCDFSHNNDKKLNNDIKD